MKNMQDFYSFTDTFCLNKNTDELDYTLLPEIIKIFSKDDNHSMSSLESLGLLLRNVLKKILLTRRVIASSGIRSKSEYDPNLMTFYRNSCGILRSIVQKSSNKELQVTSLKALFSLLPIQSKLGEKSTFPVQEFSQILECLISSDYNLTSLLDILEPYMICQDVAASLWECLQVVLTLESMRPLKPNHVKHILSIINLNKNKIEELNKTLSGKTRKYDKKKIGIIVRTVWEQLASVQLQNDVQQKLSLTLIEFIMPIIDKPVVLTDYFMSCLNVGGPNALIALQGIFNLIQKFNVNYPNVYNKLYTMFEPSIFEAPYKARFYFLSDIFLTSLCLPEGMVAGFIKKFSRLSLVAPPEDIIILLAFITNLLIRHPSLKYLINCPTYQSIESDPYNFYEKDPVLSCACDSSLWEVKLLQEHVLPSVSAAASFINNPLPSVEKDLANILENTCDQIFTRECKKKLKEEVPINFDKPFCLKNTNNSPGFNFFLIP